MENDLISRQAAIELIERMKPYHQEADDIAEMIANMPSAQPEQKTGQWIGCQTAECSECGHIYPAFLLLERFCPNRGAKMEVERENRE